MAHRIRPSHLDIILGKRIDHNLAWWDRWDPENARCQTTPRQVTHQIRLHMVCCAKLPFYTIGPFAHRAFYKRTGMAHHMAAPKRALVKLVSIPWRIVTHCAPR